MEKKIKSRKDHVCDCCNLEIKKGSEYYFSKHRLPKFDNLENQIGIEFVSFKTCEKCHAEAEKDQREWDEYYEEHKEEIELDRANQEHRYP